tara:strand:- start:543 stop:932 length:390 start_codon:yes stop_codon:yes gene_type:complete
MNIQRDPIGEREVCERALAIVAPKLLPLLPAIEGCDPWVMTTKTRKGVQVWTYTIACTERRLNGYSNHASAQVFWTPKGFTVVWNHGQGHYEPLTAGSTKRFQGRGWQGRALRHIATYAKHDADVYVIC